MSTLASHDRPRNTFEPRDLVGRVMHDVWVKLAVLLTTVLPLAIVNAIHDGARAVSADLVLLGAAVGAAALVYRTIIRPLMAAGRHIEAIPGIDKRLKRIEQELGIVGDDPSDGR